MENLNNKKAVILLSGGLDSATVAAIAKNQSYDLYAISFRYGQKHEVEISYAKKIADFFEIKHHIIIDIPVQIFQSSSLTKASNIDVPKKRDVENVDDIPSTYVPARNILFLSYALAFAESINCHKIFIGVNALDYSGYPDCRPEFIDAYQAMANVGTKAGVNGQKIIIETPLLKLKKSEIITRGTELGVDYSITHSCYDPDLEGNSCGECDSCLLRKKGFEDAGVADPTTYVTGI